MNAESLQRHFEVIAEAPNGILKLRELILKLAVRGNLVPQDSADEPAAVLLDRIEAERQRAFDEGRSSKPKPFSPLHGETAPFKVPVGWEWARLEQLAELRIGRTPSTKVPEYWTNDNGTGVPWISIGDMPASGVVGSTKKRVSDRASVEIFKQPPAPAGTLLMSFKLSIGKLAFLSEPAYHNEAIVSILPPVDQLAAYLQCCLRGVDLASGTKGALMGDTLNRESLGMLLVPLPPLREQLRIVAKVDELMALCDELEARQRRRAQAAAIARRSILRDLVAPAGDEELAGAWRKLAQHLDLLAEPSEVRAMRDTIRKLAIRGRLVAQSASDEPVAGLLDRIRADKLARGERPPVGRLTPGFEVPAEEQPYALPCGWAWVRLGTVSVNRDGERVPVSAALREGRRGPYPYYGASGVIDSVDAYLFDKTLLLIGEDGANLLLRSTPIAFLAHGKYWVNNHAHVLDGISVDLLRYLALYINAIDLSPYVTGTAQPKLNQARLNSIPIALPPADEQRRIVDRVEALMAVCEELEQRLAHARDRATHLAAAVVHRLTAA